MLRILERLMEVILVVRVPDYQVALYLIAKPIVSILILRSCRLNYFIFKRIRRLMTLKLSWVTSSEVNNSHFHYRV